MEYRSTGITARPERTAEMFNAYYITKRYGTVADTDGLSFEGVPSQVRPARRRFPWRRDAA